jgi:hypothetical protein
MLMVPPMIAGWQTVTLMVVGMQAIMLPRILPLAESEVLCQGKDVERDTRYAA